VKPETTGTPCEDVRQQLADYVLGTLPDAELAAIRRHLRGCGSCRADAAHLDQGISLFATAAHVAEPPPELQGRVMATLSEEWSEAPAPRRPALLRRLAVAAVVAAVAGSAAWAGLSQVQANRFRADAASYRSFLGALGGRNVRVAVLKPDSTIAIEGSAILYDSDRGQSWILVLARAPGYSGDLAVTVSAPSGRSIPLRPLHLDSGGDASTWLVTSSDISPYDRITVRGPGGSPLASGVAVSED
jgi:anti-sigma-K factor RskA